MIIGQFITKYKLIMVLKTDWQTAKCIVITWWQYYNNIKRHYKWSEECSCPMIYLLVHPYNIIFQILSSFTHILHQQKFCIMKKQIIFFSKLQICETKDLTFLKAATIPYPKYIFWFKRPIYIFFSRFKKTYVSVGDI